MIFVLTASLSGLSAVSGDAFRSEEYRQGALAVQPFVRRFQMRQQNIEQAGFQ